MPKTDESISPDVEYKMGRNAIAIKTLDLGMEFCKIKDQLNVIIQKYFNNESTV